jgi:hypothetical protein
VNCIFTFQVPRPTRGILALVLSSTKVAMVGAEVILSKQVDVCVFVVEAGKHFLSWFRR